MASALMNLIREGLRRKLDDEELNWFIESNYPIGLDNDNKLNIHILNPYRNKSGEASDADQQIITLISNLLNADKSCISINSIKNDIQQIIISLSQTIILDFVIYSDILKYNHQREVNYKIESSLRNNNPDLMKFIENIQTNLKPFLGESDIFNLIRTTLNESL